MGNNFAVFIPIVLCVIVTALALAYHFSPDFKEWVNNNVPGFTRASSGGGGGGSGSGGAANGGAGAGAAGAGGTAVNAPSVVNKDASTDAGTGAGTGAGAGAGAGSAGTTGSGNTTADATPSANAGQSAVPIQPRPTSVPDCGYSNLPRGYYDVQGQGVRNDYCCYTNQSGTPTFTCYLAGNSSVANTSYQSFKTAMFTPLASGDMCFKVPVPALPNETGTAVIGTAAIAANPVPAVSGGGQGGAVMPNATPAPSAAPAGYTFFQWLDSGGNDLPAPNPYYGLSSASDCTALCDANPQCAGVGWDSTQGGYCTLKTSFGTMGSWRMGSDPATGDYVKQNPAPVAPAPAATPADNSTATILAAAASASTGTQGLDSVCIPCGSQYLCATKVLEPIPGVTQLTQISQPYAKVALSPNGRYTVNGAQVGIQSQKATYTC
jgi:hypothetical protein